MKRRRLITSNATLVESYLSYSREKVAEHKIVPKLAKLISEWDSIPLNDREEMLNKINDQTYQIFTKAEKQCRKLRTGQVDYSPELSKLGL